VQSSLAVPADEVVFWHLQTLRAVAAVWQVLKCVQPRREYNRCYTLPYHLSKNRNILL